MVGGRRAPAVLLVLMLTMAGMQAQNRGPGSEPAGGAAVVMYGRAPVSDAMPNVRLPKPGVFDLPNGLHVMVLEDHRVPQVSFTLVMPGAGGYFDPAGAPGTATFTAAMLREGTTTRTSEEMARELEILSASLDVTADVASPEARIAGTALTEHLDAVLAMLGDVLRNAAFPAAEWTRYQQRTRAALTLQAATPAVVAGQLFAQLANRGHPAERTAPSLAALAAATPAQLAAFHRARYVPDHAALAIAGDLSLEQARTLVTMRLGSWQRAGTPAPAVVDPDAASAPGVRLVARPNSVQTTIVVGAPAIRRTSQDFTALQVLNDVLGAGPTGRLFVRLREEKGYTYGAFSTITAGRYRGTWSALTDVGAGVTGEALRDLLAEIARLRDQPIDLDELRRHQRAMVASFALSLESPQQMLGYYLTGWQYGLPDDYWETQPARTMAVTADAVQRAATAYLDPGRLVIVAVGDAARTRAALSAFGPITLYTSDGRPLE